MKRDREYHGQVCATKVRYATRVDAHDAITGLVNKPRHERKRNLHSYPCKVCGGFHITSKGS